MLSKESQKPSTYVFLSIDPINERTNERTPFFMFSPLQSKYPKARVPLLRATAAESPSYFPYAAKQNKKRKINKNKRK
jgi:hypothetical protein